MKSRFVILLTGIMLAANSIFAHTLPLVKMEIGDTRILNRKVESIKRYIINQYQVRKPSFIKVPVRKKAKNKDPFLQKKTSQKFKHPKKLTIHLPF